MPGCSVCKIRYEDFARVMEDGIARSYRGVFAMQVMAHTCDQCGERYLGHGYHVEATCYCCPECALVSTAIHVAT